MQTVMRTTFIFTLMLLIQNLAAGDSKSKIPPCDERPDFLLESPIGSSLEPGIILAARSSQLWIESEDAQILLRQNFKTGQKEFVCANLLRSTRKHFSILAPTVIDNSPDQKTGSTVWQFQATLDGGRLGSWNQVTKLVTASDVHKSPKQNLSWTNATDDYKLRIKTKSGEYSMTLLIEYDPVPTQK